MIVYELFVKCTAGHTSTLNYTNKDITKWKVCPTCGIIITKQLNKTHKTVKHQIK